MIVSVLARFEAWVAVEVSVEDGTDLSAPDSIDADDVTRAVEMTTIAQGVELLSFDLDPAAQC
jgi:hypothetical protein